MTREATCDIENFDIAFQSLISDITPDISKQMESVVPKYGRKGAKMLREQSAKRWNRITGSRYSSGFSSKSNRQGPLTTSEIGNKNAPGLVHLLEKGHNTLTGRRVAGIKHVAPVYDEIAPEFEKAVFEAVGIALEG